MSQFQAMFDQLGGEAFSTAIPQVAPYFGTIDPEIYRFEKGLCALKLRNQQKVHNHLGTVHAIAMCNAAELVAGMATDSSVPEGAQWIPQGMTVAYVKKAKTDLDVTCDATAIDFSKPGEITVPVVALDEAGNECFNAQITMNVKFA